jgi:hypothetical protein
MIRDFTRGISGKGGIGKVQIDRGFQILFLRERVPERAGLVS